ncbi:MAG TPA: nucleotidyltransferase domain-containing protein [Allocoleopsis sp.]
MNTVEMRTQVKQYIEQLSPENLHFINPQLPLILTKIRSYLQTIYQDDLTHVILFGSQARGEAKKDSDLDILIVLNHSFHYYQEVHKISQFISDFSLEENILISCCFTNREKWETENSAFYRNIRREGIIL